MTAKRWRMDPRIFPVPGNPDLGTLLTSLTGRHGLCALDSAGGHPRAFSIVAFDPVETLLLDRAEADWIEQLRSLSGRLTLAATASTHNPAAIENPSALSFLGGVLTALAYDLGAPGEQPPAVEDEPWQLPLLQAGLYVDFFYCDHVRGVTLLILGHEPGDGRLPCRDRADHLLQALEETATLPPPVVLKAPVRCVSARDHQARIQAAKRAIGRGDYYQVNLAHRFIGKLRGSPVAVYRRLREHNPAPFMAYFAGQEPQGATQHSAAPPWALLSSSPELLFETDGRSATTRPIKGTISRSRDPAADEQAKTALLQSGKDLAELTMIVDLERNDLGRVALPGGVRVTAFPRLESYPSLHHLVADIVADLKPGIDAWQILAALFPGGSITGAPKLAAMEAIAELESEGRGFFTGSIGYVDCRGYAQFNLLIRTICWRRLEADPETPVGEVSFRVGGGITWGSDPCAEDEETLTKAEQLRQTLQSVRAEPRRSNTGGWR